jgi:EAL domain-containing protein (putative c-di-GMP-specific phosphodiesterase class I)
MRGPRGTPYETPPMAFAMAATLDLLEELDTRCLEMALEKSFDGLLFMNVHPRTMTRHDGFWSLVGNLGSNGRRRAGDVVFEIVEHSVGRESDILRCLAELRALGFRIALDDLGEGASGLRRLIEFAPDFAKIDRFFISGIDRDRSRRAIVDAIARIGRELGTYVIAEGVETDDERAVLCDLGVPLAQGWLFGKPEER